MIRYFQLSETPSLIEKVYRDDPLVLGRLEWKVHWCSKDTSEDEDQSHDIGQLVRGLAPSDFQYRGWPSEQSLRLQDIFPGAEVKISTVERGSRVLTGEFRNIGRRAVIDKT